MFFKTLIAFILVCIFTFSTAFPVAVPGVNLATRTACSDAVENLVKGINQNIAVQKNEQGQTTVIQQELAQPTPNKADFQSSKSKLIDIVNQGISIRTNNQKIAPKGNAAIPGLATVATAQATELKMVQALTGNPSTDNPNLKKLQTMFSGGISQNQKNAQAAATGCTI